MGRKRKSGDFAIPYTYVRDGRLYWEPRGNVPKDSGCDPRALGPIGPEAEQQALTLYRRLVKARRGGVDLGPRIKVWPRGSIGEGLERYRRTAEWLKKSPATREEWERVWFRVDPVFGDVDPNTVTLEHLSSFRTKVEKAVSLSEAHRCIKVWRALWQVLAALKYCKADEDPSVGIVNNAPRGRTESWREWEIARIAKRAWRDGYKGLAALLAIMWDGGMSPVDARTLTRAQRRTSRAGTVFSITRAKTGEVAMAPMTRRAIRVLDAYLATQTVITVDQPMIRTREGAAYRKNSFAKDFRTIRELVFPGEKRQMRDIRRTVSLELAAGQADPKAVADALGNDIDSNKMLQRVYQPAQAATVLSLPESRRRGRRARREAEQ